MGLFWKLFCSMVAITLTACAIGSFVLIDAQFQTALDREVTAVYEENDLLRYTLARELESGQAAGIREAGALADHLEITTNQGQVAFRLSTADGENIGGSGTLPVDAQLCGALKEGQRGWELERLGERTYLHAASPLVLADGTLYLENCREVGAIFTTRQEQYQRFSWLMLGLLAAVALMSLGVSALMLRPLRRLSQAARAMAGGQLHQRVKVDSDDELGQLSRDFNAMAEQLEGQVQALTDAARRQSDFLGSFAHESKTPLTSIIGYADLIRSRPLSREQVRQSADYIFQEGRRLEALSRKLMDLIVLERQDFPLRQTDMEHFLSRVAGAFRPALDRAGVQLQLRAAPGRVPLEPDLMETVCLNLLDNARKALDRGGVIQLEGTKEEGGYCISVTDNGKGIPAEDLARVTEPFYMVDKSRARAQGGAGLGLALCRRVVELHGGRLEIQSQEGRGTRVSVHLKGGRRNEGEKDLVAGGADLSGGAGGHAAAPERVPGPGRPAPGPGPCRSHGGGRGPAHPSGFPGGEADAAGDLEPGQQRGILFHPGPDGGDGGKRGRRRELGPGRCGRGGKPGGGRRGAGGAGDGAPCGGWRRADAAAQPEQRRQRQFPQPLVFL